MYPCRANEHMLLTIGLQAGLQSAGCPTRYKSLPACPFALPHRIQAIGYTLISLASMRLPAQNCPFVEVRSRPLLEVPQCHPRLTLSFSPARNSASPSPFTLFSRQCPLGSPAISQFSKGAWLVTGKPVYLAVFRYWLTIFAVVFGVGVVSGLVMSYEFGTNWAGFAYHAGPLSARLWVTKY